MTEILKLDFFFFLVLPVYCYQPISLHSRAHMLSHVTPWTAARQAPLSVDFSRQEYWSGLPSNLTFFYIFTGPHSQWGPEICILTNSSSDPEQEVCGSFVGINSWASKSWASKFKNMPKGWSKWMKPWFSYKSPCCGTPAGKWNLNKIILPT